MDPNYPYTPQPNFDEDDNIDIKRYLSLFISNWYWFLISLFIAITIAYGINRYSEKIFTVSSTLLIKDGLNGGGMSLAENIMPNSNIFNNRQNLNNEMGILKSFRLNKRVIDSLPEFRTVYFGVGRRNFVESRMYKSCPFMVITKSVDSQPYGVRANVRINSDTTFVLEINGNFNIRDTIKFGERFNKKGFDFIINLRDSKSLKFNPELSNKYYFFFTGSEELANAYRGKLGVNPIDKDATLVNLSASGYVVEQEVDYLNKLMEIYLNQGLEDKNQIADSTIKFINRQLELISDSLKIAEEKLQNFRLENKLVDLSKEGNLIQGRLEQYENEKTTLDLQHQYYQYLKSYLDSRNESGDIVFPAVMGVTDPTLGRLVQELATLQQKKKQLSMNLSGDLPAIDLIEQNIITTRKSLLENVESNLVNLQRSIDDAGKRIEQVYLDMNKIPGTERKLINIQRKFDINNTVYTYLLEKRAETGIARASNVSDNKIIDEAENFNAALIKPKTRANNVKAFLLGLFIPGLIIALLYYFNNKIIDNRDIAKRTRVPIIGYISHNDNIKEIPVIDKPGSALSESFRAVRTTLRYFIKDTNNPVIAITSTISSEGKTFVSINLATITALLGKKVLLVGLDLRRPRLHKVLGIENNQGLSTYLIGNCEYDEVIKETSIKNLYYATSGPVPPNPTELIEDEKMDSFIKKAKKQFDYIFIDTPPVAVVSDTLLISRFVDINLFIVRQRYSSKNTLELIQELYKEEKLMHMGIIINDISLTGYYGYGIRYGYYKGYGYSYGKNYYGQYSYSRYGYSDKEHGYYNT
jgi:capsular exopolysaccharide synthesis family protein